MNNAGFMLVNFSQVVPLLHNDSNITNLQRRNLILKKVRNYTDDELNPSKENFLDNNRDDYVE